MTRGTFVFFASAILAAGAAGTGALRAARRRRQAAAAAFARRTRARGCRCRSRSPRTRRISTRSSAAIASAATATRARAGGLSLAAFDVAHAAQNAGSRREGDPQAAGRLHAAAAGAASRCARRYAALIADARDRRRRGGGGETESRRPHVPAAEPSRVRARDPRSARARRRRRQLAAARHQERELRQHRRRAGAVADAARGVPERGGAISRMAVGDRNAPTVDSTYSSPGYVSQHPVGSRRRRAVRHARRHRRRARVPGRRRVRASKSTWSPGRTPRFEDIDVSIDGERVALLDYETGPAGGADGRGAVPMRTEPILVKAGQHEVAAAFVRKARRPVRGSDPAARLVVRRRRHRAAPASPRCRTCAISIIKGPYKVDRHLGDAEPRRRSSRCRPTARRKSGRARGRSSRDSAARRIGARSRRTRSIA